MRVLPPLPHPSCPGRAGDAGEGDAPEAAGCSHVWVGEPGLLCRSGVRTGCCVGHPLRGVGARDGCPFTHSLSPPPQLLAPAPCRRAALLPGISHPPALFLSACAALLYYFLFFSQKIAAIYFNNRFSSRGTRGAVGAGGPQEACGGPGVLRAPSRGILPYPSSWLQLAFPSPAPPRALLAHLALSSYLLVHIFQALICLFGKAAALPRFDLPMISRALLCKGLIWCPGCRLSSLV